MSDAGVLEPTGPNRSLRRSGWLDPIPFASVGASGEPRGAVPEPADRDVGVSPLDARTPTEFVSAMRHYLARVGDWSYAELEYRCGGVVSAATFRQVLEGDELPGHVFLVAFVTACVGQDDGECQRWTAARSRLRAAFGA